MTEKKKVKKVKKQSKKRDHVYSIARLSRFYHISIKVTSENRDKMTIGELRKIQSKLDSLKFASLIQKHVIDSIANKKIIVVIK